MIRAFRGEFGLKIRFHVPQIHALLGEGPQAVEIEQGEEALYPRATEHIIRIRNADDHSRGGIGRPPHMWPREERFQPEPYIRQNVGPVDVVICPRKREYGESKNWAHWATLNTLPNVFAAGAPDSSYDVTPRNAWLYDRFTDASIEAMRKARLCVATDAGLAHLAVLCGTPLLLLTHEGRVAPGPVVNSKGHVAREHYWPVKLDEYYHAANHMDTPIWTYDHAWTEPDGVRDRVMQILRGDT